MRAHRRYTRASKGSAAGPRGADANLCPAIPFLAVLSVSVAVVLAVAAACSHETTHRVLVFFYDGVPSLDDDAVPAEGVMPEPAPGTTTPQQPRHLQARRKMYTLPPYAENNCEGCHNVRNGRLVKSAREGLCQTCHPDKPPKKKYVHGPMAVNGCLMCHHYHKSEYPKVLLADAQTLCFHCHEKREMRTDEHHATIEQELCIDCHDAHGGDDRLFLLPKALATGPT